MNHTGGTASVSANVNFSDFLGSYTTSTLKTLLHRGRNSKKFLMAAASTAGGLIAREFGFNTNSITGTTPLLHLTPYIDTQSFTVVNPQIYAAHSGYALLGSYKETDTLEAGLNLVYDYQGSATTGTNFYGVAQQPILREETGSIALYGSVVGGYTGLSQMYYYISPTGSLTEHTGTFRVGRAVSPNEIQIRY